MVLISERTEKPSPGIRPASAVRVDPATFAVLSDAATDAQRALEETDDFLGGVLAAVNAAQAAATAATTAAGLAMDAAEAAQEAAEGADGGVGDLEDDLEALEATVTALGLRTRLVAEGSTATISNTVAETTMVTVPTPSTVVAGDVLVLRVHGVLANSSGSPVTFQHRTKLGATTLVSSAAVALATSGAFSAFELEATIRVVGLASQTASVKALQASPVASGTMSALTAGAFSGLGQNVATEDLSTPKNLVVTIEMGTAVATAGITVTAWELLLLRSPTS